MLRDGGPCADGEGWRRQLEAVADLEAELVAGFEVDGGFYLAGDLGDAEVEVQLVFRGGDDAHAVGEGGGAAGQLRHRR